MQYKKTKLTIAFVLVLTRLSAQMILTSGGSTVSNGGMLSYSVGQVVYTLKAANSQRVLQPSISTNGDNIVCSIYPNPTTDIVTLKVEGETEDLIYKIYDINGKIIQNEKIERNETIISMKNLMPSVYLLEVICNKGITSFKIIKN